MNKFSGIFPVILIAFLLGLTTAVAADNGAFSNIQVSFELENEVGDLVTQKDLRNSYTLLAFGFTQCAHVCPMMAANMAMALKASDKDAIGVFISVDTERDTPQIAQAYASSFHESMIGLGGSYEQVKQAASNFGVSFVVTKSNKAYTVEHTSDIFLIGPDGDVIEVFALNAPPGDIASAINKPLD